VCCYSNTHPREAKREKLERYVIEASKQCGRNVLMKIDDLTPWEDYVRRGEAGELRLLAHPGGESTQAQGRDNMRVAVGPEGGFTEEEVESARIAGWRTMNLGPRILRIETAAIVMAMQSIIHAIG
jgi:16S rRNA (uracil1498-N3)-methyltransferase